MTVAFENVQFGLTHGLQHAERDAAAVGAVGPAVGLVVAVGSAHAQSCAVEHSAKQQQDLIQANFRLPATELSVCTCSCHALREHHNFASFDNVWSQSAS